MRVDYYSDRRNRSRGNKRGRETESNDVIVAAISAQVVLCLILILALIIYRQADREGYSGFKAEYSAMVGDSARNGDSIAALRGITDGIAEAARAFEQYLSGLFSGIFSEDPSVENGGEDTALAPESQAEDETLGNYNYLGDKNAFFTAGTPFAGGGNPVLTEDDGSALPPPEGSTLSPVILGAYVKPPVTGLITSPFGYRYHPLTQESDFHTGMDIAAAEGMAILAALPGEVKEVGESSIYGKYIIIQHATNLKTFYGHCSEVIAEEGMAVRQGERIAKVGSTGVTTGPHLHFGVIVEEQFADPYWLLMDNIQLLEDE